jgi:hypothetical protein
VVPQTNNIDLQMNIAAFRACHVERLKTLGAIVRLMTKLHSENVARREFAPLWKDNAGLRFAGQAIT